MLFRFPLIRSLPLEPEEPPLPEVPPVDPQAVDAASFVRIGLTADFKINQVVDLDPLPFRSVLFSCFFRGAPKGSSTEPMEFYVYGENRVRIFFYWVSTVAAETPRESKFRIEFSKSDGSVFGSDFLFGTDLFMRQNSWHHILVHVTINETHDGFERFRFHLNTSRSLDVETSHFTAQDSTFVPANTEVGFHIHSGAEPRHAAFEPSIAYAYCEIATDDDISEAPIATFVNLSDGAPLVIERSFGGVPLLYIAGNDIDPLHNYITEENLTLSTTDWRVDGLHPIVTCCYQAFQHTHLALKQTEEYVAEVVAHVISGTLSGQKAYFNMWFCDCFEDKGSGAWFIFEFANGKAIIIHLDAFMHFYTYDYENNTGFSYVANPPPLGWVNYSFYADDSTIPKLKINNDPAYTLTGQTAITSPPYPRPSVPGLTLVVSTPTQHFGVAYGYLHTVIEENPGIDFTDLDTLAPNFTDVNNTGEPVWNGIAGDDALGFRPSIMMNPATGLGVRSAFPFTGEPNQATSGFSGRCTYFKAPTVAGRALPPHTLFDEITFKV